MFLERLVHFLHPVCEHSHRHACRSNWKDLWATRGEGCCSHRDRIGRNHGEVAEVASSLCQEIECPVEIIRGVPRFDERSGSSIWRHDSNFQLPECREDVCRDKELPQERHWEVVCLNQQGNTDSAANQEDWVSILCRQGVKGTRQTKNQRARPEGDLGEIAS